MKRLSLIAALAVFATLTFASTAFAAEAVSSLSWEPPTTRVDGTPMGLEEIGGYKIYYSVDAPVGTTSEVIDIQAFQKREGVTLDLAPRAEDYVVYFAISTVDTDGLESALSEPVSKTFNLNSTAAPATPTNLEVTFRCGEGCTIEIITAE